MDVRSCVCPCTVIALTGQARWLCCLGYASSSTGDKSTQAGLGLQNSALPHLKCEILMLDLLHIAANGGCGHHGLPQVQAVQHRGLPCIVQPHQHKLVLSVGAE